MEPMSIAECKRQLSSFHGSLFKLSQTSFQGTLAMTSTLHGLSLRQRVVLVTLSVGGFAVYFASKYLKRKRQSLDGPCTRRRALRAAARKARKTSTLGYNWAELQKASGADDATDEVTLVDGTPLTPQQLGLMGMEALETVVGYWEDALTAYNAHKPNNKKQKSLTSPEETEFTRMLENILEGAYQLQDDAEHMFIHEHSLLNRKTKNRLFESSDKKRRNAEEPLKYHLYKSSATPSRANSVGLDDGDGGTGVSLSMKSAMSNVSGRHHLISVSTVDQESFVSAQDTIADLKDFDEFEFTGEVTVGEQELYEQALCHLEKSGIPCRVLRTEFVGVESDAEYLAKLHCLRLSFKKIMENKEHRLWWEDIGRNLMSGLIMKTDKDPKDFVVAYDELLDFLNGPDENMEVMKAELAERKVQITNFYDVAFDYILIDSFEDLDAPPSSVVAIMQNRWLSDGFKEGALRTAIWSVVSTKRKLLKTANGFKAKFYGVSEILLPILAWGFFGPDEDVNYLMNFFKDQVLTLIRDLYNFENVRYSSVDSLAEDIMALAKTRVEATIQQAQLEIL